MSLKIALQPQSLWQKFTEDVYDELQLRKYPVSKLFSIKIILKENHIASASYTKVI